MARGKIARIEQIDIETGKTVEIYNTIAEAADDNWLDRTFLSKKLNEGNGIAWFTSKKLLFWKMTNEAI